MTEEKDVLEVYRIIYLDSGVRLPTNMNGFGILDAITRFYHERGFFKIENIHLMK
jgi:hypothetical protein